MVCNFSVASDGPWQSVQVLDLPPACMPSRFEALGSVGLIQGYRDLVPSAIETGVFLNVKQLKAVVAACGVQLPPRGSGIKHVFVKIDFARATVKHFHSDKPDDKQTEMITAIMGHAKFTLDDQLLEMVERLDPENKEAYKAIQKQAHEALLSKTRKQATREYAEGLEKIAADTRKQEEIDRQWRLTPNELKQLLPGEGAIPGVFHGSYNPRKGFFRVVYPSLFLSC